MGTETRHYINDLPLYYPKKLKSHGKSQNKGLDQELQYYNYCISLGVYGKSCSKPSFGKKGSFMGSILFIPIRHEGRRLFSIWMHGRKAKNHQTIPSKPQISDRRSRWRARGQKRRKVQQMTENLTLR